MGRMDRGVVSRSDDASEENVERQMMGCMAGFLHIIDPSQFLGRRSTKRIPSAGMPLPEDKKVVETRSESPAHRPYTARVPAMVCRDRPRFSFDVTDVLKSSEKIKVSDARAPRLSLDSRLEAERPRPIRTRPEYSGNDLEDRQRNSPGIVARLMGLEELPDSSSKAYTFRQSVPDSRALPDLSPSMTEIKQIGERKISSEIVEIISQKVEASPRRFKQSKGFRSVEISRDGGCDGKLYGEIERRLKMRGINDHVKDLCSLKQILEVLPFNELAYSANHHGPARGNYVFDSRKPVKMHSPVVVKNAARRERPLRQSSPLPTRRNCEQDIPVKLKGASKLTLAPTPKRFTMLEAKPRNCKPMAPELIIRSRTVVQRKASSARRKDSEGNSPRQIGSPRAVAAGGSKRLQSGSVRSPRNRNRINQENLPANIGQITSTSSATESETHKSSTLSKDEYGEGSVSESTEQPSLVSVLDANCTFCNDDWSPSPVRKRSIVFQGGADAGYDLAWMEPFLLSDNSELDSDDFRYVSEVVLIPGLLESPQATRKWSDATFLLLESHGKRDVSNRYGRVHRRLVFDTVMEILQRRRDRTLRTSTTTTEAHISGKWLIRQVWSELQMIRRPTAAANDLFDAVNHHLIEKDFAVNGWTTECPAMTATTVLDMERLIFKDLICETFCELTFLHG